MDTSTPEPQDAPDPRTEGDTNEIPQTSVPTEAPPANPAPAPAARRSGLSRPWMWVGIAAAALLLGAGIFVTGLVAGKTLGGEYEWHRDHEVGKSQSIKTDSSEDDDEDEEVGQAPESKDNPLITPRPHSTMPARPAPSSAAH